MSPDDAVDLNVTIRPRDLPESVKTLREQAAEVDRREWDVTCSRIETHLAGYKLVVGHLEALHAHVIETTDLDPEAYSRPAAMWLVVGRCLGLIRLALVAVEAGVCGEVLVVLRRAARGARAACRAGRSERGRAEGLRRAVAMDRTGARSGVLRTCGWLART